MTEKEQYMHRALDLARQGAGHVSPNPMVGCVVVKNGKIIGEGYHERYGEYHAERNALMHVREDPQGADLYVTLEPCCHYGKTPPCTEIIIEKKIRRVFIGATDPNPKVAGKGIEILKNSGIEVETGILEEECLRLNEVFFHYIQTGTPFVIMKYAMSLDGKIACSTGDSQWITGEAARKHVHELRKRYASILVGINTVIKDDPMLNCRLEEGVNPIRIVCDSSLRIPVESRIMQTAREIPTILVCTEDTMECEDKIKKVDELRSMGAEVIAAGRRQVDLTQLMKLLGERRIDSVLVEGGGQIHGSLNDLGLAHKIYAYIGNKIIGGVDSPGPVKGKGALRMIETSAVNDMKVQMLDEDVLIEAWINTEKMEGD